ncbi:hypothetical protein J6590_040153 [Homalodisca vitripennis]|nr:hypothetical protein J6590_040153 [Homalodisca vitripennis]
MLFRSRKKSSSSKYVNYDKLRTPSVYILCKTQIHTTRFDPSTHKNSFYSMIDLGVFNVSEIKVDLHRYETRGRDNYRAQHHRLTLSRHLPCQVCIRLINKLPESMKTPNNQNKLNKYLYH